MSRMNITPSSTLGQSPVIGTYPNGAIVEFRNHALVLSAWRNSVNE